MPVASFKTYPLSAVSTFQGVTIIDVTDLEAFLVRMDGDTGDVFTVNTLTPLILNDAPVIIDITDTEALLVRKDADGGDVFIVDTSNSQIELPTSILAIGATPATAGAIRLTNNTSIQQRNSANNGNLNMIGINSANLMTLGDSGISVIEAKNPIVIDLDSVEALLIRKDGDTGDILTVNTTGSIVTIGGEANIAGDLNHDGTNVGLYGVAPVVRSAGWTITNDSADRTFDANAVTINELADALATFIRDVAATGLVGAVT